MALLQVLSVRSGLARETTTPRANRFGGGVRIDSAIRFTQRVCG